MSLTRLKQGFQIGQSYLAATVDMTGNADASFPVMQWTLGGFFFASLTTPSAGSDISINGGDSTLIDIATDGWYQATLFAQAFIASGGGSVSGFEILGSFETSVARPHFGQLYAGLPVATDLTQASFTTGPLPISAGQSFSAFAGGYMSNPAALWDLLGGVMVARLA